MYRVQGEAHRKEWPSILGRRRGVVRKRFIGDALELRVEGEFEEEI